MISQLGILEENCNENEFKPDSCYVEQIKSKSWIERPDFAFVNKTPIGDNFM